MLYLLISVVVLILVLEAGIPLIKNMGDKSYFEKTKKDFTSLDDTIKQVAEEGEGSQRVIPLEVRKGSLSVKDNKLFWEFNTEADILSHKSQVEEGTIITMADIDVACMEKDSYYIIENSHLWLNLTKAGTSSNHTWLNSSEIINTLKWKHTNSTAEGIFTFMINNDPTTTVGKGYTLIENCGYKKDFVKFNAYFYNVSASFGNISYLLTLELDASSDYVMPKIVLT